MLEDIRKRHSKTSIDEYGQPEIDFYTEDNDTAEFVDNSHNDMTELFSLIDKYKERTESVTAWLEHDEKMLSTELRNELRKLQAFILEKE